MGSIGASMMLSKSVVLAAPALLYPIWSPWLQAGAKNLEMYTKGLKCLGLWRAKVNRLCGICTALPQKLATRSQPGLEVCVSSHRSRCAAHV